MKTGIRCGGVRPLAMRGLVMIATTAVLQGCAVVTVAGAVVGTAASVAGTAVSTAADVAGAAVRTTAKVVEKTVDVVTGGSSDAPAKP